MVSARLKLISPVLTSPLRVAVQAVFYRAAPPLIQRFFQCKPRHAAVGGVHAFGEHRQRTHPHAVIAVERAVHGERLFGFAVAGDVEQLIEIAFVVAVDAKRWKGLSVGEDRNTTAA